MNTGTVEGESLVRWLFDVRIYDIYYITCPWRKIINLANMRLYSGVCVPIKILGFCITHMGDVVSHKYLFKWILMHSLKNNILQY